VYEQRPRQCKTWPFWDSNLRTPEKWKETCEVCPGSGRGKLISVDEILRQSQVLRL
jgi:Fe-S-cluster containining protein